MCLRPVQYNTMNLLAKAKQAGYSEYRLCKIIGKNPKYIRNIRNGSIVYISFDSALIISDLLKLDTDSVMLDLIIERATSVTVADYWKDAKRRFLSNVEDKETCLKSNYG